MKAMLPRGARSRGALLSFLVPVLLLALPLAVWLDLRNLSENALRRQASDLNSVITGIRGYYASHIVGRVLASPESTQVLPNYEEVPGAIPIPATLSLELGRVISEQQANISYRFVSDFPFKNRTAHALDAFETRALVSLRDNPNQQPTQTSWSLLSDRVRHITPIIMGTTCVACHNTHPDSPKSDWKVGDIDRKSTRLNSSHSQISYAVFCLKKNNSNPRNQDRLPLARHQRARGPLPLHLAHVRRRSSTS